MAKLLALSSSLQTTSWRPLERVALTSSLEKRGFCITSSGSQTVVDKYTGEILDQRQARKASFCKQRRVMAAAASESQSGVSFAEPRQRGGAVERLVWRGPKPGSISDLQLVAEEMPGPAEDEVLVAVRAVGLNFADVFTCLGLYSAAPKGAYTPGLEFAGTVEAVGLKVRSVAVGDRVLGVTRFGAYASHLCIGAAYVRQVPSHWSWHQAAAFPVQALTMAYALLSLGQIQPCQTVLVHSAAGGCGLVALAICRAVGARPVATVGSKAKADFLLSQWDRTFLPESQIIVRTAGGATFGQQLKAALASIKDKKGGSPEGFDIVLDSLQGDYFSPGFEALARGGRHIVFGAAAMTPRGDRPNWLRLAWQFLRRPTVDPLSLPSTNKAIMGFNLIWMFDRQGEMDRLFSRLQDLDLPPPFVGQTFPFSEAPGALRRFQSGATVGKVTLEV